MKTPSLYNDLKELNELLERERSSIIKQELTGLAQIQQEKAVLLSAIREHDVKTVDKKCREMVQKVTDNNRRNSWVLKSGLNIIAQFQSINRSRQTLTYNPYGTSCNIDGSPKLLNRRF